MVGSYAMLSKSQVWGDSFILFPFLRLPFPFFSLVAQCVQCTYYIRIQISFVCLLASFCSSRCSSRLSDHFVSFRFVFHSGLNSTPTANDKFNILLLLSVCLCIFPDSLSYRFSFVRSVYGSHLFNLISVRLAESWFFLLMICFYYTVKIEVGLLLFVAIAVAAVADAAAAVCTFSSIAPCWFFSIRSFSRSIVSMHHFMVSFIVATDCLHTQRFNIIWTLLKWITLMEFHQSFVLIFCYLL